MPYFSSNESAAHVYGTNPTQVIPLIASAYMGRNPEMPFIYRAYNESGIVSDKKAQYVFDFDKRFPEGENGEVGYAIGDLYCPAARPSAFNVSCMGPVTVFLNGERVFISDGNKERNHEKCRFPVTLKAGLNRFIIECERTQIGFGCLLQNAMPQWEPCNYIMPFEGRGGESGFLYSAPRPLRLSSLETLLGECEQATEMRWFPDIPGAETPFMSDEKGCYFAWSAFTVQTAGTYPLKADFKNVQTILLDGAELKKTTREVKLKAGEHQIALKLRTACALYPVLAIENAEFHSPVSAKGRVGTWLYAGPFKEGAELTPDCLSITHLFDTKSGIAAWRSSFKDVVVRPYAESALFGRWTYPLGVTLYGLMASGKQLGRDAYLQYVKTHVAMAVDCQRYAQYETERYGFAGINQQLCWLTELDDCGSFGSLMLECNETFLNENTNPIADRIADHMRNKQERLSGGAFYRGNNTMWADDMYMSIPFMCRYGTLSGDKTYWDDCLNQLLCYKEALYMPEKRLMSHMRCLNNNEMNGIPWSRGNGWVIFALSELMQVLPEEHAKRDELIAFYADLVKGYMAVQGDAGLWHQILDEPGTYPEASATAMFICAFARGILGGYIPADLAEEAAASAKRAWAGLCETAIDRNGNLFGVCRGSGFSFSRPYYRTLSWNLNDTHGIGIVMLAGAHIARLGG